MTKRERIETAAPLVPERPTLESLRAASRGCQACNLWRTGTRTVFGEGAPHAEVMLGQAKGVRPLSESSPGASLTVPRRASLHASGSGEAPFRRLQRLVRTDGTHIVADLLEDGVFPLDLPGDRVDHRVLD